MCHTRIENFFKKEKQQLPVQQQQQQQQPKTKKKGPVFSFSLSLEYYRIA
jgi:hypothetical protein